MGAKSYALLRSLVAPQLLQGKLYEDLQSLLKQQFNPKPLVIAERFHFHRRNQTASESVNKHAAELQQMASTCKFGEFLNEALRDRFVCRLRNKSTQKCLLSESDLTFHEAKELAQGMEAAETNAKALKGTEVAIKQLAPSPHKTATKAPCQQCKPCFWCGRTNHAAQNCRFADATCHNCGKKGHIVSVCQSGSSTKRK